jgi:hypothetical protein
MNPLIKKYNLPPKWYKTLGFDKEKDAIVSLLLRNIILGDLVKDSFQRIKELEEVALTNIRLNKN